MNTDSPVLGVLIPCRNEVLVLARKLSNLALVRWPRANRPHRIVVVNDGSLDRTEERARELGSELFASREDLEFCVVENGVRPGKSGAISAGLAALSGVDLFVLTDADVVLHPGALVALAEAFADSGTGMVSGSQRFVHELNEDGSARAPGGASLIATGDGFDFATAKVRAFESRFGKLFSVHGQLLGWRASLGVEPTPGIAADDIDLALSVRALSSKVRLCRDAVFYEEKPSKGAALDAQALRRARAYIQVVGKPGASIGGGLLDRLQFGFYRHVPLAFPELLLLISAIAVATGFVYFGGFGASVTMGLIAMVPVTRLGRLLFRTARLIRRARSSERELELSDSWEMERS